jgi:hypothetical protein
LIVNIRKIQIEEDTLYTQVLVDAELDLYWSASTAVTFEISLTVDRPQLNSVVDQYAHHVPRQDTVEPERERYRKLHQVLVPVDMSAMTSPAELLPRERYPKPPE